MCSSMFKIYFCIQLEFLCKFLAVKNQLQYILIKFYFACVAI